MNTFNTPILFLIFNRLDTTIKVFQKIKEIKPKQLFIAADGPRANVTNEKEVCSNIRNYVLKNIDWDCEVKTLFRDNNLGCGKAVSESITWFFKHVDQGIILEDDCLPNNSFFKFCEEMLDKYKNEEKIYIISGFSPYSKKITRHWGKYGFVKIPHIWGWATWKRAWNKYDFNMIDFKKENISQKLQTIFPDKRHQGYWKNIFTDTYNKKINTWDYQLAYTVFKDDALCINSSLNLISNIGFGGGTHTLTKKHPLSKIKQYNLSFPINTLLKPDFNTNTEAYDMRHNFLKYYFMKNILKKLKIFNLIKNIYNKI